MSSAKRKASISLPLAKKPTTPRLGDKNKPQDALKQSSIRGPLIGRDPNANIVPGYGTRETAVSHTSSVHDSSNTSSFERTPLGRKQKDAFEKENIFKNQDVSKNKLGKDQDKAIRPYAIPLERAVLGAFRAPRDPFLGHNASNHTPVSIHDDNGDIQDNDGNPHQSKSSRAPWNTSLGHSARSQTPVSVHDDNGDIQDSDGNPHHSKNSRAAENSTAARPLLLDKIVVESRSGRSKTSTSLKNKVDVRSSVGKRKTPKPKPERNDGGILEIPDSGEIDVHPSAFDDEDDNDLNFVDWDPLDEEPEELVLQSHALKINIKKCTMTPASTLIVTGSQKISVQGLLIFSP